MALPAPTDINSSPNYNSSQHAEHHNDVHAVVNEFDGETPALLRARSSHTGTQTQDTITGHTKAVHDALSITDPAALHTGVANEIDGITEKASPIGADIILIEDSEAAGVKKKVQFTNLPGGADADAIHDNVAAEINAIATKATPVSGDLLLIEDSAAANAKKKVTVGSLPAGVDTTAVHKATAAEISAMTNKATPAAGDHIMIEDSADSNNKKRILISSLPTGSVATPGGANEIYVSNVGGTGGIWIQSRGAYAEAYRGTEANFLLDMQACVDSLPTRQGTIEFANVDYDWGALSQTDSEGRTCRLIIPPGVTLQGAGSHSAQSSETAATHFKVSGAAGSGNLLTCHDGESGNNGAEWLGFKVRDIHFSDETAGSNALDNLIIQQQGNTSFYERCSFGDLKKAGSVAMKILQAPGGQTTQFSRIRDCEFDIDHGGVEFVGNSPDWELTGNNFTSRLDLNPSTNSFAVKGNSSAIRIFGGSMLFWDRAIWIDCENGEGKHWTLDKIHFEGYQNADPNTFSEFIFIDKSDTAGWSGAPDVDAYTLITGCDAGNTSGYTNAILIDDGASGQVYGTRVRNWRVRGSQWATGAYAKFDAGTRSSIDVA